MSTTTIVVDSILYIVFSALLRQRTALTLVTQYLMYVIHMKSGEISHLTLCSPSTLLNATNIKSVNCYEL